MCLLSGQRHRQKTAREGNKFTEQRAGEWDRLLIDAVQTHLLGDLHDWKGNGLDCTHEFCVSGSPSIFSGQHFAAPS